MKLEKREVTLNELDTLRDQKCFTERLLTEYVRLADEITSTERRREYLTLVEKTMEEIFLLADLIKEKEMDQSGKKS
ncbi:MAG: hypothetical protein IKC37_04755 [Clostridia bacterium]|nr:hypothetical protein [Clostridia bacterium]